MPANSVIYGVYFIVSTIIQVLQAFSLRMHVPMEVGCSSNKELQSQYY